jgi:hypothetical protein
MTGFLEPLPVSCPPSSPRLPSTDDLWRLLRGASVTHADFDSQRKRLPNRPYPDECTARSVSLVVSFQKCVAMSKSPRLRGFTHAVRVPYAPHNGVWDQDAPEHVNWWPYAGTDPLHGLGAVEAL